MRETGASHSKMHHESNFAYGEILSAATLPWQPYGSLVPTAVKGRLSMVRRIPVGVVGAITPWNSPSVLGMRVVAPALALGNAVVLKPDPQTPVIGGAMFEAVFREAGLPEGLLQIVVGGADVGEALVTDPNVNVVSFTGSTAAGRRVGELAGRTAQEGVARARRQQRVHRARRRGSRRRDGRRCVLVVPVPGPGLFRGRPPHRPRERGRRLRRCAARQGAEACGWATRTARTSSSARSSTRSRSDASTTSSSARSQGGARLVTGGTHEGLFYQPTVLAEVTQDLPAWTDEIFGPVAPVTTFRTDEEALALANNSEYGLVGAVYSRSISRGLSVANRIKAGMVHVNDGTLNDEATIPFGGTGMSGNGSRYGGEANLDNFTEWQWVTVRDEPPTFPF